MPSVRDLAGRRFAQKNKATLLLHRAPVAKPNDEGLSYFGGLPRLPPEWPWPEVSRRDEDGPGDGPIAPTFIAQVDLSSLPMWPGRAMLPTIGVLYFFCNTQFTDVGDPFCRVLYYPGSCAGFRETPPPPNLMRLGGSYDSIARSWIAERSAAAGVDFKYALSVEPYPFDLKEEELDFDPPPEWMRATTLHANHPLLMYSWPQTPTFFGTFKANLVGHVERAKLRYDGTPWPGFLDLMSLVQALPDFGGDPHRWLSDEERNAARATLIDFVPEFDSRRKGAAHVYSLGPDLDETVFYCAMSGFAEGRFDRTSDHGRLQAGLEHASKRWRRWARPHQMLGVGAIVQSAPYEHVDDALLLQISGVDFLGASGTDGVLQIWGPPENAKVGIFDAAVATFECS